MRVVILQPSYIPWRGYFHLVKKSDLFVFYDCVQYDKHGWRNRNIIKTPQGNQWLTVPVHAADNVASGRAIRDIAIAWKSAWAEKHKKSIRQSYSKCPHFHAYEPLLEEIYNRKDEKLADFTCATTEIIARALGITQTRFLRSSNLHVEGGKTDRLVNILKQVGATCYLSGPSAKEYLEADKLKKAGVDLEFMEYDYPDYPQINAPFSPHVSILDLIFNVGPDAPRYIWQTK